MPKIDECLKDIRPRVSGRLQRNAPCQGHRLRQDRSAACSPSALITLSGLTPWALPSLSRSGLKSAADCADAIGDGPARRSAFPAPSPSSARLAWATATWAPCCCSEETDCFCFLAGHESFAAAEGAIGIARTANKVRKEPLRVILNGLGKDAAMIICRINGFTYVKTDYRLQDRRAQGCRDHPLLRGRARCCQVLRRQRRSGGRCHHEDGGR